MRPTCALISRAKPLRPPRWSQHRSLLTLAIETSCDDTSVAVLEKHNLKSELHFHERLTSDNRAYQGVHPVVALESHQKNLATLVSAALQTLPVHPAATAHPGNAVLVHNGTGAQLRKKPDFVTVTRGPGMRTSLFTGLDTAKGLAVAWQVPLLAVNHMQAHALTPRLVSSLEHNGESAIEPQFPFLSVLVSGGHTMVVRSQGLCDHQIMASITDHAVGEFIDKCARHILPPSEFDAVNDVMYGPLLESFAFPQVEQRYDYTPPRTKPELDQPKESGFAWRLTPPLTVSRLKRNAMEFSFSGLLSSVARIMEASPDMPLDERRVLAKETMRVAFEHLSSRVVLALKSEASENLSAVVVSGGVASNQYLKHVLRAILDAWGYEAMPLVFPPPRLCTDNAAMIAWTGMEMWEAGWRSELDVLALRKWSVDPNSDDGGILGVGGWTVVE